MKISMKLVYEYIAIFYIFYITPNHLHPLQVANCDSNSRLVVDEDANGKFKIEIVEYNNILFCQYMAITFFQHGSDRERSPLQRPQHFTENELSQN